MEVSASSTYKTKNCNFDSTSYVICQAVVETGVACVAGAIFGNIGFYGSLTLSAVKIVASHYTEEISVIAERITNTKSLFLSK